MISEYPTRAVSPHVLGAEFGWLFTSQVDRTMSGAATKFRRAREHLKTVQNEIERVTDPSNFRVRYEVSRDDRWHEWFVEELAQLDPSLPLCIGDAVHNYRSTLDHVAWELVRVVGIPPGRETGFPITTESEVSSFDRRLPREHPLNELLANYLFTKETRSSIHPLLNLGRLDNADKHRMLLAAVTRVGDAYFGTPQSVTVTGAVRTEMPIDIGHLYMRVQTKDAHRFQPDDAVTTLGVTFTEPYPRLRNDGKTHPEDKDLKAEGVLESLQSIDAYINTNVLRWADWYVQALDAYEARRRLGR